MNIEEEKLFKKIKEKLPNNVSFIDAIADVLDISYDAAYRRINGKTSLTLNDGLLLSNQFNINLNELIISKKSGTKKILVEKTHDIISDDFLRVFFDKSKQETQIVLNSKKGQIINCAKDYPFYHSDNGSLKKFRIYLFINMLSKDSNFKKTPFSKFNPSADIVEKYEVFLHQYEKVSLVEI